MKRIALLAALVLVVAACGDDAGQPTASSAATPSSSSAVPTTGTASTPTTAAAATSVDSGPTDCLEIWPETIVQGVAGTEFTFFDTNPDRSACTYTNLPNGIALAWRTSDLNGYEQGRIGADAISGAEDVSICDAGYFTELQEAIIIMEGYSASQGRTYTATVSGVDLADARTWAETLIQGACG